MSAYKRLNERPAPAEPNLFLTDKERDILSMVARGKSDAMIARKLHMSVHTVDSHMRKIFRKLETNNRTMAVVKALTLGLIHLPLKTALILVRAVRLVEVGEARDMRREMQLHRADRAVTLLADDHLGDIHRAVHLRSCHSAYFPWSAMSGIVRER